MLLTKFNNKAFWYGSKCDMPDLPGPSTDIPVLQNHCWLLPLIHRAWPVKLPVDMVGHARRAHLGTPLIFFTTLS